MRSRRRETKQLCPSCRVARVSQEQHRRLAAQGFVIIAVLLLALTFLLLYPFTGLVRAHLGRYGYPLAVLGLFLMLCLLLAATLVLHCLVRMRRMSHPGYALKIARISAGEVGENTKSGPVSVYAFGANDPGSMLEARMSLCRKRFGSLIGDPFELERPLRFFVFGKRSAFNAFFKWAFLYGSNLDGFYVPWSTPTIAITTDSPAYRLADPERVVDSLIGCFYLDCHRNTPAPLWVQTGIGNVVACGGDRIELARLNRKMLAALSRGTLLGAHDLFDVGRRSLTILLRDWRDSKNFRQYAQRVTQSWSVVEFLCSEQTRLECFRAFLMERARKASRERAFECHFGYGLEALLERWRFWILDRGIGRHDAPPRDIRDALLERVIPLVQNQRADELERIQAIREMGRAGYALGADALIDLLDRDHRIPTEEVVWSLESISGRALGNDVKKWMGWFHQLPLESTLAASHIL